MALRLTRLELTDWRGFADLRLDFDPTLTVLVGENGAGKSAVLEAIAVAAAFKGAPTPDEGTIRSGQATGTATLRMGAWHATVTLERRRNAVRVTRGGGSAGGLAVLYGLDRSPQDLTPEPNDGRTATALDRGVSFTTFFSWFHEREDVENERIRDDRDYRDDQLECVRNAVSVVSGLASPRVRRGQRPRLGVAKAGTAFYFDQLSSGERALVALAGDIARRLATTYPQVPPAERSGVMLIDEIDQHLHPRLQREVVARLRSAFPAVQWVLTTHSPLVAMHVPTECVRVLRDFELIPTPPTEGRDANALLADLFGVAERPAAWQAKLDELARLIDDGKLDEAKVRLAELAATLGDNDPTVVEHQTMLAVLEG